MTHKVLVTMEDEMHKQLKIRAKEVGVTIQEYIRHLVIKDREERK